MNNEKYKKYSTVGIKTKPDINFSLLVTHFCPESLWYVNVIIVII